jgi:hypothetical protein
VSSPQVVRRSHVKEENKCGIEYSVVSDLPPTEEVSDNELDKLDELEQDFGNLKSGQFENQPSDNSFPTKHLPFNQCTHLNTYSHSAIFCNKRFLSTIFSI